MRSVRKAVVLPVNSGSRAIFARHGFPIPAQDFLSTSYLKLLNKLSCFFFRCSFCFLKKHTSTVAKLKQIIAETISEQLPVVVEKITTQVNRADPVPDR